MDPDVVKKVVEDVLTRIQNGQKLKCPKFVETLKPLKDLEKFDSPMSLAATGMIARKLDVKIKPKTNVFGDDTGLFTIKKTIDVLCKLASEQKKQEPAKV